jgi:adenosylcobyric acid synthase
MTPEKRLSLGHAQDIASGEALAGYEIHVGQTTGTDCARPWLRLDGRDEGAVSACGRVRGCYLHGLFAADEFRAGFLRGLGHDAAGYGYEAGVEDTLDALADHLERHMDIDAILALAEPVRAL